MGKAARKLNKALQKNKEADTAREIQQYRERVSKLVNEGKFASAVDVLAEAATKKIKDVELMYDTAYCYFMVGDYERAGRWISNVLTVSPGNRASRILLGRLCLLQDRVDDGLAIFDYVLKNWREQLPEADLQEIGETLEYYGREMPEKIRAGYPEVARLLEDNDALGAPEQAENSSALEAVRDKLAALKRLTEKAAQPAAEPAAQEPVAAAEEAPAAAEQPAAAQATSAADTLARLKAKLAALKADKAPRAEQPEAAPEQAAPAAGQRAELEPAPEAVDELEPEEVTRAEAKCDGQPKSPAEMNAQAAAKRDEVMAMALSLEEKIGALNNFAGAYYFAGAYQAAEVLLKAALQIDPKRPETIRNLAVLLKESGDTEAALQCAARLPIMDFALLALLRSE